MPIEFVSLEEARERAGLRMVVVPGVPSPWGEAAKGILHVKQIPWVAVRLESGNDAMARWTGERSGPVAMYEGEAPRGRWDQILWLAERLAPKPSLVPETAADRALMLGLCQEICGEMGLGWCRRNAGVHGSLTGGPGFPEPIARYLGDKYGYRAEEVELYTRRQCEILQLLAQRLHAQRDAGSDYYLGSALTALDIYSATFTAMFAPLPQAQCAMAAPVREAFQARDEATNEAFDPILVEHRDRIYAQHLELPLTLQ